MMAAHYAVLVVPRRAAMVEQETVQATSPKGNMTRDRSNYTRALGQQLRFVRTKLGLTLLDVETNSGGAGKPPR